MNDPHLATLSSSFTTKKLLAASTKPLIISNLFTNLYGPEKKNLLINKNEKMILTSSPLLILENLRLIHPLQILIKTYCEKMEREGDGALFMIVLFNRFLKAIQKLLTKNISDLRSIKGAIEPLKNEIIKIIKKNSLSVSDYRKILTATVQKDKLIELLLEIISRNSQFEIQIVKIEGGIFEESYIFDGLVAENAIFSRTTEKRGELRSVLLNAPFDINRTETKGVLLFEEAEQLENFEDREDAMIKNYVENLNADLIICQQADGRFRNIADEKNLILLECNSKIDFMRYQRFFGGKIAYRRENFSENETGTFCNIGILREGDKELTQIRKKDSPFLTVVLKETIDILLNENERLLKKGLTVLKKVKNNAIQMVRGAGHIENIIAQDLKGDSLLSATAKNIFSEISLDLPKNENIYDVSEIKIKSVENAFDLLYDVLACEDYLMVADEQ